MAECQTRALLLCYLTCIHGRVSKKCDQYLFLSLILWMSSRALAAPDLYSSFYQYYNQEEKKRQCSPCPGPGHSLAERRPKCTHTWLSAGGLLQDCLLLVAARGHSRRAPSHAELMALAPTAVALWSSWCAVVTASVTVVPFVQGFSFTISWQNFPQTYRARGILFGINNI